MELHGEVIEAGIDYCTATSPPGPDAIFLKGVGFDALDGARRDGNAVKPWAWKGYRGWSGGGVSLGDRGDGSIVRLSGDRASGHGEQIVRSGANVARLDLQATVRFSRDFPGLADRHAQEAFRDQQRGGKQRRLRHQRGFGRGDSLYMGSRQSNYYGRVYDKSRESGDERYRNCWRYEVECKDDGAKAARKILATGEDVAATAAALVHDWFRVRGCAVRYRPRLATALPPIGATHSDVDTWLGWLLQAVRPTVQKCLLYVPRETIEEILFGPSALEKAGYSNASDPISGQPVDGLADRE